MKRAIMLGVLLSVTTVLAAEPPPPSRDEINREIGRIEARMKILVEQYRALEQQKAQLEDMLKPVETPKAEPKK